MKKAAIIFFSLLLASGCSVKEQGIMAEEIPVKTYEVYSSATTLQLVQNAQAPYFDAYHDTFVIYTFEGEDFVEYTFEREAVLVFDPEEQRIVNTDIVKGDIE